MIYTSFELCHYIVCYNDDGSNHLHICVECVVKLVVFGDYVDDVW
jgi:hypothetical protein